MWDILKDHEARFWGLVDIRSDDECWPWRGNKDQNGYGRFSLGGTLQQARRCAFVLRHGPLGWGARVVAKCKNPACVNPDHLRLWTPRQKHPGLVRRLPVELQTSSGEGWPLGGLASSYGHKKP